MEMGTTENFNICRPTIMATTPPWSERKIITDRNAAPKSLGCSAQEEWEGGTDQGRSKIDIETSERDRGGEE